MLKEYSRS